MRVNNTTSNPIQNGSDVSGAKSTGRSAAGARATRSETAGSVNTSDSVKTDISARAREFAQAKQIAAETPDTREDKIADLKRRISEGKYNMDSDGIADRMVNEHMHMGIG